MTTACPFKFNVEIHKVDTTVCFFFFLTHFWRCQISVTARGLLSSCAGGSSVRGFCSLGHVASPVVVSVFSSCVVRA